ncbi:thioredoxin domain-containing protein [Streptomyces sp. NPDC020996]|uniref:DsbA family protein n=1 Tax=Streptomyces sp. NPDC020996 TaxID=3154791 RepID=UPI0033DA9443
MTAVVAVALAAAAVSGCGGRATARDGKDAYAGVGDLPEKLAADGTTIVVGDPEAPVTLRLYEDPRCPVCEEFESADGGGPAARDAMLRHGLRTEYTMASFLDEKLGGHGSQKAVNALRAALEEGKFAEYHEVLYRHQPEESVDGFTDAHLLQLASKVDGLRGPAFDSAVRTMKYRDFVAESEQAYDQAGDATEPRGPGTPTAVINGTRIPVAYSGLLYDRQRFDLLLTQIEQDPESWADWSF